MTITDIKLKKYHDNGYITPYWKFSSKQVQLLKKNIDQILLKNPNIRPEQIVCPHIKGGTKGELNNSPYRRAGIVYRYMSSHSNFNRKFKNHDQKDGHSVNYSKRPIWLINGSKKNNTLVKIHY